MSPWYGLDLPSLDEAEALAALRLPDDLQAVGAKVVCGERLDYDEGLHLYEHPDLLAVGRMANFVRARRHGDVVYYNVNRHINPTNICYQGCVFCAFGLKGTMPQTWEMSHEEVFERAGACAAQGATEIHIVAGVHPQYDLAWYETCFQGLKERHPEIHLKALTAVEVAHFADDEGLPFEDVLARLKAAGMDSMPGGGAEIFHPEIREQICDTKCGTDDWFAIHRAAHGMGLRTNATMLYGHIERAEHRVDHALRIRELQDETGGFQTFVPLAFHPENTALDYLPGPSGLLDLRVMAASRLLLDNFPHMKAYWIMLGAKTAQVALAFGANDLDGTVVEERIVHMAGATSPEEMTVAQLRHLIEGAGRIPQERDTLYNPIHRNATQPA